MRALVLPCLTAALAVGQELPAKGILHVTLLELDMAGPEIVVRDEDHRVYRCLIDGSTYFARERQPVAREEIKAGDRVSVAMERKGASDRCHALMVVAASARAAMSRAQLARRLRPYALVTENIAPRGNLTMAGVLIRRTEGQLVLRTRTAEQKTILLRDDTRFLQGGVAVEPSALRVNTRIFVRAGKNLDDEIEAYQVVWGEILPRP